MSEELQQSQVAEVTESQGQVSESTHHEVSDWRNSLPEDIRSEASLQDFKDPGALAKSYVHAQRMLGNSIRIPGEDASEEAKQDFYNKLQQIPGILKYDEDNPEAVLARLGKPEKAEQYTMPIDEDLQTEINRYYPEGINPISEEAMNVYKEWALSAGLTQSQAKALLNHKIQDELAELEYKTNQSNEARSILEKTWGNEYDNRLHSAKAVLNHYQAQYPDAVAELTASAGNNPVLAMVLAEYGKLTSESGVVEGITKSSFGITPEEARAQIQEIRSNNAHPFNDKTDSGHQAAVEKMHKLYSLAYPK